MAAPVDPSKKETLVYYDVNKINDIETKLEAKLSEFKTQLIETITVAIDEQKAVLMKTIKDEIKVPRNTYLEDREFELAKDAKLANFANRLTGGTLAVVERRVGALRERLEQFALYRRSLTQKKDNIYQANAMMPFSTSDGLEQKLKEIEECQREINEMLMYPETSTAPHIMNELEGLEQMFTDMYGELNLLKTNELYTNSGSYGPEVEVQTSHFSNYEGMYNRYSSFDQEPSVETTQFDIEQSHMSGGKKDTKFLFQEFLRSKNYTDDN